MTTPIAQEELKSILSRLKKIIRKDVGTQCKEYAYGCIVCDMWYSYNTIETLLEGYEED